MRRFSEWVCSHDKMNTKTDNTFNDPFCVRTLMFEGGMENLVKQENPKDYQDLVGFE